MSIVSIQNLGLSFGHRDIFEGVSAELPPASKVGLVGPNGVGKTSLLRILNGMEEPTAGHIHLAGGIQLGYLQQEAVDAFVGHHHTVYQEMLTAFSAVWEAEARMREMEAAMAAGRSDEDLLLAYGEAQDAFERAGGYEYERRIEEVLQGLGFDRVEWDTPVTQLSGGQKTRALLARLLLERPTLLILDEPTNHLDVEAIEWLERTLRSWQGALLVASHDRYFLDRVVDRIWEMSPTGIEVYRGNYTAYLGQRQERWERNQLVWDREVQGLRDELELVRRYHAWRKFDEAWGKLQRLARRLRAIEVHGVLGVQGKSWGEMGVRAANSMTMEEAHAIISSLKPPARPPEIHMRLRPARRSGQNVLRTENLTVGYPGRPLVRVPDLLVERTERVAIMGSNGAGKTTLLRTVLGQVPALTGGATLGASLTVGYFAQTHDGLNPDRAILDELLAHRDMSPAEARNYLAQYLFRGDDVWKPVSALSGGERARLALAILNAEGVNFLLLDEPTNHLDIPAREVLEEGLAAFEGTILLVSHDRYLIHELATQIWEIRDGELQVWDGTYAELLEARERASQPAPEAPARKRPAAPPPARQETAQARLASLEAAIADAETELAGVTQALEDSAGSDGYDEVRRLSQEYAAAEARLTTLMQEWEMLVERV